MTTSKWIKDESGYTRYLSLEIVFHVLSCDFILWEFHTRLWWNSKGKTHDWRQTVNFYTNSYDIDLCFKMSHIYFDRVNENNSKTAESKVCFMVLLLFCLFVFIKSNYLAILCFPILRLGVTKEEKTQALSLPVLFPLSFTFSNTSRS